MLMEPIKLTKYKCTVAYDGSSYAGFQIQPNAPTIQGEIEQALASLHGYTVKITASGRTDAGVHARGQVFHFESPLSIPTQNWSKALNTKLNSAIRILDTAVVDPTFHARYDAMKKEYRYFLHVHPAEDPFARLYSYHIPYELDFKSMQAAAELLVGEHDFTAFSSAKTEVENKVRRIYKLDCRREGDKGIISCEGNGFLQHMVRIIVGTLVEVGSGKRELSQVRQALLEKKTAASG